MDLLTIEANGASFNVAVAGKGRPLLLLHGWPEFWWCWAEVMDRLQDDFQLIAPDLRGFGDSDKPEGPWGAADHAADMLALMDAMDLPKVGVVGHDVGGAVMQSMARAAPDRFAGLFFFGFVHPGIGARMGMPDRLSEIWYQSFNQMDFAPGLIGRSREACRLYVGHILRHWAHVKEAFADEVLDRYVENFLKPGNLAGGFAWYRAAHAGRIAIMDGTAPKLPPIQLPTRIRWPAHDPIFPAAWIDTLGETFSQLDVRLFEGVGHFPHREDPDTAAAEIDAFFG